MKVRYYTSSLECDLVDISSFVDLPEGRFTPGSIVVHARNRDGHIAIPWKSNSLPGLGEEITVEVETDR